VTVCCALESQQCHNGSVDFEALAKQHKDAVYRQMIRVCGNRRRCRGRSDRSPAQGVPPCRSIARIGSLSGLAGADRETRLLAIERARNRLLPLLQLSMLEDEGARCPGRNLFRTCNWPATDEGLLNEAVDALPVLYRPVYELCDVEDLRGDEVAQRLESREPP